MSAPGGLLEVVLVAAVLLLAVILFVIFWNILFGEDATQKDADRLTAMVQEMIDTPSQYNQTTFLVRAQNRWIYGFDKDTITISSRQNSVGVSKPPACGDFCFCTGDEDTIDECASLTVPVGTTLVFQSRYYDPYTLQGYQTDLVPPVICYGVPTSVSGALCQGGTPLTISKFLLERSYVANSGFTQRLQSGGLVPILVEKYAYGNTIIVTVLPDTEKNRQRGFRLRACPDDGTVCAGKTATESFDGSAYCAYNVLNTQCSIVTVDQCAAGKAIRKPCLCSGSLVTDGVCANGRWFDITCPLIQSCSDYCTQSFDPSATCSPSESSLCAGNPCGIQPGCTATPSSGGTTITCEKS